MTPYGLGIAPHCRASCTSSPLHSPDSAKGHHTPHRRHCMKAARDVEVADSCVTEKRFSVRRPFMEGSYRIKRRYPYQSAITLQSIFSEWQPNHYQLCIQVQKWSTMFGHHLHWVPLHCLDANGELKDKSNLVAIAKRSDRQLKKFNLLPNYCTTGQSTGNETEEENRYLCCNCSCRALSFTSDKIELPGGERNENIGTLIFGSQ